MQRRENNHKTDLLFTLALFCVFAACVLMVITLGAGVYGNSVDEMEHNFDRHTSVSYIATKLRASDVSGGIAVGALDGVPALMLSDSVNGVSCVTRIYCYEDSLCEVYTLAELTPSLSDGQKIMALSALDFTETANGALSVRATLSDGSVETLLYSPRCAAARKESEP